MANAQKLIQQNKLDKAIKELQKILEEDPKDVRTILKIGDLHAKLGNKDDARQSYMQVAAFYGEQGFYLKAVAVYKQILRVDPNLVDVNLKLAELYHQLGLMNDCVTQYQTVANILDRLGKTKESLAILKKMVDLDAENVASRIKLAELYSGQGMAADAIKEFDEACKQLKKQDRVDDYIKVAERLLFHDAARLDVARDLASLYLTRSDPKRALGKLQVCFKANPRDPETLILLAQAFQDQDQIPKTVSVLRELAKIHAEEGNQGQADATWQRVLQLAPDDEDAKRAMGLGPSNPPPQVDQAIRHEPSFVGAFPAPSNSMVMPLNPASMQQTAAPPQPGRAPSLDGGAPAPTGKKPTGLGALQGAPSTPQEQVQKLLMETEVYIKYGLREKAIDHIKKVFALDPDHLEAHEKLRGLLIKAGNIGGAADEVIACFRIAMGRGDKQRARGYLSDLTSIQSTHPAIATMREELDGVPAAAPMAINVLRRTPTQGHMHAVAPPPQDISGEMQRGEEDVAVVVDGAGDDGVAVELSNGGLEINPDDVDQAFVSAGGEAAPDVGNDLASEMGDAFSGMTDMPTMDAHASARPSQENEFDDFLRGDGQEGVAVASPGDDAGQDELVVEGPSSQVELPAIDDLAVVPPPDDEPVLPPPDDEPMVGGDGGSLEAAGLEGFDLPPDSVGGGGFDDGPDDPGLKTQALDRDLVDQAVALVRQAQADAVDDATRDFNADRDQPLFPEDQLPDMTVEQPLPPPEVLKALPPKPVEKKPEPAAPIRKTAAVPVVEKAPEPPPPPPPPPVAAAPVAPPPRKTGKPKAPVQDMALDFFPDELAEADFFIQQGLYDEAKEILTVILDDVADSPRALRMMAVATALENGEEPPPEEEADVTGEEDGAFDLARELDEELSGVMQSLPAEPQEQVSVEAVLSEFKKGVDKLIAPDDANTHHDLGIAYKEMGLLDDAVGEFERASRNAQREADALYMVGICRLEQGNQALAAQAFRQALQASIIKDNQRTAVNYELGSTLEAMGELADALEAFHAAQAVDSHFKDLAARIASLAPRAPKKAPGSNGNGAHAAGGKAGGDAGKKGKNIGYI